MSERIEVIACAAGAASVSRAVGRGFADTMRVSVARDRQAAALSRIDAAALARARSRVAAEDLAVLLDL